MGLSYVSRPAATRLPHAHVGSSPVQNNRSGQLVPCTSGRSSPCCIIARSDPKHRVPCIEQPAQFPAPPHPPASSVHVPRAETSHRPRRHIRSRYPATSPSPVVAELKATTTKIPENILAFRQQYPAGKYRPRKSGPRAAIGCGGSTLASGPTPLSYLHGAPRSSARV